MLYLSYVTFQHSPPLVQPLVMMTFVLQDGQGALYAASLYGHLEIVKTLIDSGAEVNQCDNVGTFIFSVIAMHSHTYTTIACMSMINM